ncbi:MAG: TonB-dependent receptor, partial [Rhodanobacter sp.]|nr:TonB-dependent receptor [Rhodanobacter sp.]
LVGQTATLNLAVGAIQASTLEAVNVSAMVLPETKTSEIATYVSQKEIEALPQGSRNFLAFADTVPGMVFSTDPNDGSTKLTGGAQNSNGINVYVDGVGQKNYVLKGGVAGQDSSRGNPFPQLGIAEYKVITSNYKAEFDQLSSAAIVAVTRSGTNEFKGQVFGDYTNQNWRSPTVAEEKAGIKTVSSDKEFGASFGGPIIKDQMHFFATYERKEFNSPREVQPGQNYTIAQLPANLASLANATTGAPFTENLYFGKLDWEPGDRHLFELTTKYRKEDELTGIGGTNTAAYGTVKHGNDTRIDLRYQYSADRWLNDAHLTYEDSTFGTSPKTMGPGYQLTTFNPWEVIINAGGGRDFQSKGQKGTSIQDDVTFNQFDWNGNHTIKTGVKLKAIDINAFEQQPYNPQLSYDITNSLAIPYQVQFGSVVGGGSRNIISHNKQFGIYVQDDWEVNQHLLFNLGVRWDYEQTPAYNNYVTPAGLVTALRNWSNIHQPGVDYNIENYISNGNNRSSFKGAFQPRLGFSYDINADQKHVFFGGVGRSYDRNLFDYLALEQSKSTFPSYTYQINSPGHPCTVGSGNCLAWDPSLSNQATLAALVAANPNLGSEVNLMNNNLKTPYSDQFSVGMRNIFPLLGNDWNSSVTLARIVSHDGIVFTLGNRHPDGTFRPAGTTWGGQPWGDSIPGYGTLILASNGTQTKLNSVLVSLDKPYTHESGWGVTLAYTYSDALENNNNAYSSDEHYSFDYPNLGSRTFTRTLGLARHRLVATGIYDAIWGITVSSKLTLASPTPQFSIDCHNAVDWNHCFFNPFTPNKTIGYKQFDLALQKEWSVGGDVKFRIRGDMLNVFNWRNYTNYDTWRGGPAPDVNTNFGNRNGDGIAYPTRMFKLTAGLTW